MFQVFLIGFITLLSILHDLSVYPRALDFLQYVCGGASAWHALVPAGDIAIRLEAGVDR